MKNSIFYFLCCAILLGCSSDDSAPTLPDPPIENLPIAVNDEFTTMQDIPLTLNDLMSNDTIFDFGRIAAIDNETTEGGTLETNNDNTYTYIPLSGFVGTDTFTYTLCDNKLPANCSIGTVTIRVGETQPPQLTDDAITLIEDTETILDTLLENDMTLITGANITTIDTTTSTGTIVLNADGTITYTPQTSFVGEDTFTYTVCNGSENTACDTATVTITIADQGTPMAVDDSVRAEKNKSITFATLLANDTLLDDAVITAINGSAASGSLSLNADGTVTYSPQMDYVGIDTFTYTICDDDTPTPSCATATVNITVSEGITFNIPSALVSYYENTLFITNSEVLLSELKDVVNETHTTKLSYGQRHNYLYDADEDQSNPDNVILMYSSESRYWEEYTSGSNSYPTQTFNTEHVFPKSKLDDKEAENDLHHLRTCDAAINSLRSYYSFTDGSGTYQLIDNNSWYPGDDWRGDVARMIMYIHLHYGDSFDKVGALDLFLKWNAADPVSAIEKQRNTIFEGAQGNRNPFIDNPYLATLLWGGDPAENLWD